MKCLQLHYYSSQINSKQMYRKLIVCRNQIVCSIYRKNIQSQKTESNRNVLWIALGLGVSLVSRCHDAGLKVIQSDSSFIPLSSEPYRTNHSVSSRHGANFNDLPYFSNAPNSGELWLIQQTVQNYKKPKHCRYRMHFSSIFTYVSESFEENHPAVNISFV